MDMNEIVVDKIVVDKIVVDKQPSFVSEESAQDHLARKCRIKFELLMKGCHHLANSGYLEGYTSLFDHLDAAAQESVGFIRRQGV